MFNFFRSRFWLHFAGAFCVNEIVYTILVLCHLHYGTVYFASISALLVGIISEVRDYLVDAPGEVCWGKYFADVMSWIIGSGFWLGLNLLQLNM